MGHRSFYERLNAERKESKLNSTILFVIIAAAAVLSLAASGFGVYRAVTTETTNFLPTSPTKYYAAIDLITPMNNLELQNTLNAMSQDDMPITNLMVQPYYIGNVVLVPISTKTLNRGNQFVFMITKQSNSLKFDGWVYYRAACPTCKTERQSYLNEIYIINSDKVKGIMLMSDETLVNGTEWKQVVDSLSNAAQNIYARDGSISIDFNTNDPLNQGDLILTSKLEDEMNRVLKLSDPNGPIGAFSILNSILEEIRNTRQTSTFKMRLTLKIRIVFKMGKHNEVSDNEMSLKIQSVIKISGIPMQDGDKITIVSIISVTFKPGALDDATSSESNEVTASSPLPPPPTKPLDPILCNSIRIKYFTDVESNCRHYFNCETGVLAGKCGPFERYDVPRQGCFDRKDVPCPPAILPLPSTTNSPSSSATNTPILSSSATTTYVSSSATTTYVSSSATTTYVSSSATTTYVSSSTIAPLINVFVATQVQIVGDLSDAIPNRVQNTLCYRLLRNSQLNGSPFYASIGEQIPDTNSYELILYYQLVGGVCEADTCTEFLNTNLKDVSFYNDPTTLMSFTVAAPNFADLKPAENDKWQVVEHDRGQCEDEEKLWLLKTTGKISGTDVALTEDHRDMINLKFCDMILLASESKQLPLYLVLGDFISASTSFTVSIYFNGGTDCSSNLCESEMEKFKEFVIKYGSTGLLKISLTEAKFGQNDLFVVTSDEYEYIETLRKECTVQRLVTTEVELVGTLPDTILSKTLIQNTLCNFLLEKKLPDNGGTRQVKEDLQSWPSFAITGDRVSGEVYQLELFYELSSTLCEPRECVDFLLKNFAEIRVFKEFEDLNGITLNINPLVESFAFEKVESPDELETELSVCLSNSQLSYKKITTTITSRDSAGFDPTDADREDLKLAICVQNFFQPNAPYFILLGALLNNNGKNDYAASLIYNHDAKCDNNVCIDAIKEFLDIPYGTNSHTFTVTTPDQSAYDKPESLTINDSNEVAKVKGKCYKNIRTSITSTAPGGFDASDADRIDVEARICQVDFVGTHSPYYILVGALVDNNGKNDYAASLIYKYNTNCDNGACNNFFTDLQFILYNLKYQMSVVEPTQMQYDFPYPLTFTESNQVEQTKFQCFKKIRTAITSTALKGFDATGADKEAVELGICRLSMKEEDDPHFILLGALQDNSGKMEYEADVYYNIDCTENGVDCFGSYFKYRDREYGNSNPAVLFTVVQLSDYSNLVPISIEEFENMQTIRSKCP